MTTRELHIHEPGCAVWCTAQYNQDRAELAARGRKSQGDRFTVRKQSSGYTFNETFYVYDRQRHGRVSVHAHRIREQAQAEADGLNESIGWTQNA